LNIADLILRCQSGNRSAIHQLYDQFADEMFSTSLRITNDRQISEDILQESFLQSLRKLPKLKEKNSYQGWFRRIVINASLKHIKKKVSFDIINDENYSFEEESSVWYLEIPMSTIKEAIQQLPIRSRTIFSLYAIEDYKHSDIAKELMISISTSKTQYRYAKKLLKAYLTKSHAQ